MINRREFIKGAFACAISLCIPAAATQNNDDCFMLAHLDVIREMLDRQPIDTNDRHLYVPEATYQYLEKNFDKYIDNFIAVQKLRR